MRINATSSQKACRLHIDGIVQGVGFRPYVYRLAGELSLKGWVENRNDGVLVHLQGEAGAVDRFIELLPLRAPGAASISCVEGRPAAPGNYDRFTIKESRRLPGSSTGISPDIAVCSDCLADISTQPHRTGYPLVNCTHCGPRFTIIEGLPYDRQQTSMSGFDMCPLCLQEYNDPDNRRFHAQPVACNGCGPAYMIERGGNGLSSSGNIPIGDIIGQLYGVLLRGGIATIKGTGGYNLVCDAMNETAVQEVRRLKGREGKPFAVMFRDIESVKQYCLVNEDESALLHSWRRPVVLLGNRRGLRRPLANGISGRLNTTGAILPYMPYHYLLFEKPDIKAMVFTSANISDQPIMADDKEAGEAFGSKPHLFISYNRRIVNPVDDSVCRVVAGNLQIIRRARGFVPEPLILPFNTEGVFAAGSDLKNSFAVGKGSRAILSQYNGDLEDYRTLVRYRRNIESLSGLFSFTPAIIARDMHPGYHSYRYAENMAAGTGCTLIGVQHHHAHIASCMAENMLDEKVLGVCFDGTGYGDDGTIWGSEFLICDFADYERYAHFSPLPLPGGDAAVREPWRIALACVRLTGHSYAGQWVSDVLKDIPGGEIEVTDRMIARGINTPRSCGAGRLFDAVASLLGICLKTGFEGEAPMLLESICRQGVSDAYDFGVFTDRGKCRVADSMVVIDQVISDIKNKVTPGTIASRFHNGVVRAVAGGVISMHKQTGIKKVMISGGVFQNARLLESVFQLLKDKEFEVFTNRLVPVNDGGIALGQLAVAAKKKNSHVSEHTGKNSFH